jgi:anti-sigma B factor antagonist
MDGSGDAQAEALCFRAEATRDGNGSATLRLCGDLDFASVGAARHALAKLDAGLERIVLDLSHITFFDAAGVRFLLTAREQARTAGRDLVVRHPSRAVRRVLAITGDLPALCPADQPADERQGRPWGSILVCPSPSASPLGAGPAVAGPPRDVCSDARFAMCLAPWLAR